MEVAKAKNIITNIWAHNKISKKTKDKLFKILELHDNWKISIDKIKEHINFSDWDKIKSIEEFIEEFNNFKKYIELTETSGKSILDWLDIDAKKESESMSISMKKYPNEFSEISNLLKKMTSNIPKGYSSKEYNLYIANKIVYTYWVKDLNNPHHVWIFCEKLFDKNIESEEFKKNFDEVYKKIEDIKKNHFIDLFHFFAWYSAHNTWLWKPKEAIKLKLFKFFYTSVTWIFTKAERDNIWVDLPPELRRAYRYTLGWDTISDVAYVNTVLDAHQILVDIYWLICLKKSIEENDFNMHESINHFFNNIKNKADYKNNEFYEVTKEMLDGEIKKRRMSIIKILSKLCQSLTSLLPILNICITNFEKLTTNLWKMELKTK